MSLRAHLQMTKLHHKLCFIKFLVITSEVIIIVPLAEARAILAGAVLAEAWFQPIKVVHQGLHHLVLHKLPTRSLHRGRMPLSYPSTSAHT